MLSDFIVVTNIKVTLIPSLRKHVHSICHVIDYDESERGYADDAD